MHGEERDSRILRGTGGNKRRVSFITALTKDKLNNKRDQLENLRTIFHISELFKCWERGWTAVFENFGTQPLCNIWVDSHEIRDVRQYAGSLSTGYERLLLYNHSTNRIP